MQAWKDIINTPTLKRSNAEIRKCRIGKNGKFFMMI